jgi:hypothetical protein
MSSSLSVNVSLKGWAPEGCNPLMIFPLPLHHTLQGKSHLCIPFLGIARPQSHFPYSCVCEQFTYSQDWSTYFLQQNRQTNPGNIKISHRYKSVGTGRQNIIIQFWKEKFPVWKYINRNQTFILDLSALHLQCSQSVEVGALVPT